MTLAKAPLALDGVLTPSSQIRKGIMGASGNPAGGVVGANHLKVSANSPEGPSLIVAGGLAMVPNGYQSTPDELYTVANSGAQVVPQSDMPAASGSTTYWLVCLVVGDPTYSNAGHPYMPNPFDNDQLNTFQFNRIVLFPCTSTATTFASLGKAFPGLALARLAIPQSTTTITPAMITDVRSQIRPTLGRWNAVSTGSVTLTNAQGATDVPGCFVQITSGGTSETFDIDMNADVYVQGAVASFTGVSIDGVDLGDPAIAQQQAHNNLHGMWTVTNLSAGTHMVKVYSYNFGGSSGTALHSAGTTKLRIRRV